MDFPVPARASRRKGDKVRGFRACASALSETSAASEAELAGAHVVTGTDDADLIWRRRGAMKHGHSLWEGKGQGLQSAPWVGKLRGDVRFKAAAGTWNDAENRWSARLRAGAVTRRILREIQDLIVCAVIVKNYEEAYA